ncbi:hypothetical protein SK128_001483 [Halocaridina rubra]|uniref:Leucine--tRNA ligase n=1 Tax=Halocaridina rubra TaxID=373956 RepID=A0AAN9A9K0_HALRR
MLELGFSGIASRHSTSPEKQRENIKMKPSLSQTSPTHGAGEGVVIRGLKQRIKKLEEMVTSLDDKIRNMDGEMKENETLREQIRSLEEANKAQGQERKELEKRIKKLEGEKSQLESRISNQEDKNKQLNDNLKELDVSSLLSSERDEIAAWNVQIKENIEQFRKEFQELNMENDAMKTSFADALKGNVAVKEAVKMSRKKLEELLSIESSLQKLWEDEKIYEEDAPGTGETSGDGKFFACFPFPYMNGRLHLGHTFSLTKSEASVF